MANKLKLITMATPLLKNVRRELTLQEQVGKYRGKNYHVILEVGEYLTFRIKGTRQEFSCHLADALNLAKIRTDISRYKKKYDEYEAKKKAGLRCKKPRKSGMLNFFNPIYKQAMKVTRK